MEQELRNKIKETVCDYYKKVYGKPDELKYIPASGKVLDEDDLKNMIDATLDMWLTSGRFNKEFEQEFAKYIGVKYALTASSGSSANLLALSALTSPLLGERAVKRGDEVITAAAGFPTTVSPIIQNGAIPVFIDLKEGTYNIDERQLEDAVTKKTKAIFVAHTLGHPFDLSAIKSAAAEHNLWLIEDCCDALGAEYEGKKVGTFGDIATFSFYPAHHITMGEGGAVVTDNSQLYKILMSFRDWGRDCCCPPGKDGCCGKRFSQQLGNLPFGYDHKYTYSNIGFNLKITDWQAALGCSQLKKIDKFLQIREQNGQRLTEKLSDLSDYLVLPKAEPGCRPSWFGYLISVKSTAPFTKQQLTEYAESKGIGTRQLFAGNILRQPMFIENDINLRIGRSEIINSKNLTDKHYRLLPNTEFIMNNTFWVGVYPRLGEEETERISKVIHEFIKIHT